MKKTMLHARTLALALLAPAVAACGDESPTEAGGGLLPGEIRTIEVILEPGRFLLGDTAFAGFGEAFDVSYYIIANDFAGALDAHMLTRFEIPRVISTIDSTGVQRTDSVPAYLGGEIVVVIDSATSATSPVALEVLRLAEPWHPASATWQLRVDTTGVQLPWTQPGGTAGAPIDVATWDVAENDTVRFDVDSATIAAWRDTLDFSRGTLLRSLDPDARLRAVDVFLEIETRPSIHLDTLVTVTVRPPNPTFVYDPPIPTVSSEPRVGGITAWRTFLHLRQRLDTLRIPCPNEPGCTLPLRDASISHAALLLEPVAPPPGFAPEDSLGIVARLVLESDDVPLVRSVLGGFASQIPVLLPAARFAGGGEAIELPVTDYLQLATADTTAAATVPQRLALLPALQSGTFGYATFAAMPRLRLVLSVASELQLR